MTLTLEPQDGPQYVTERATDAPVVPAYGAAQRAAHAQREYNRARAIVGLPPVERRRYRGRA